MTRSIKRSRTATASAPSKVGPVKRSWTALLAATTLGVAGASMLHADVQTNARLDSSRTYRLVVQSYDADRARPVASTQREVTAEELRAGVRVGLLEFRQGIENAEAITDRANGKPVVMAWIEEGKADLELDGLRARPLPGSLRGTARRAATNDSVRISVGV